MELTEHLEDGGISVVFILICWWVIYCVLFWFLMISDLTFEYLGLFRIMTGAWSAPSHYLNQCWNTVNSNLENKLQWNLKRNSYISKKTHVKMSSAKWHQFCLGLVVFMWSQIGTFPTPHGVSCERNEQSYNKWEPCVYIFRVRSRYVTAHIRYESCKCIPF